MRSASLVVVTLVVGVLALAGCSGGSDDLVLDGSPFEADASGIVDAVSTEEITIDGVEMPLAEEIVVFSASTLERIPLAGRLGQYVQVGVDGDEVVWVGSVGGVLSGSPPRVLYEGVVVEIGRESAVFQSGLELAVADGVGLTPGPTVVVVIDPSTDRIVEVLS